MRTFSHFLVCITTTMVANLFKGPDIENVTDISKFSEKMQLFKVTAYVKRFVHNARCNRLGQLEEQIDSLEKCYLLQKKRDQNTSRGRTEEEQASNTTDLTV